MRIQHGVLCAVLLSVLFLWRGGISEKEVGKVEGRLADLTSPDPQERERAAAQFLRDRADTVAYLLGLAKQPTGKDVDPSDKKVVAVQLLGTYRAVEAVEFLVRDVSFRIRLSSSFERDPLARYPCAKALVQIGNPVLPAIVRRLDEPTEELDLKIFAMVIRSIEGHDIGLIRLKTQLEGARAMRERDTRI